jgi:phospholipase/carboxylesterase
MPGKDIFSPTKVVTAGKSLREADKVLIMIHGRGGSAEDILSLADHLSVKDFALMALRADGNTWYPYSFMAPPSQNEPWLSTSLNLIKELVDSLYKKEIALKNIFFLGFSQGACLMLEFAARNAVKYGGIIAFTGGLIGDKIYSENYKGDFDGTLVFIGSSNPDPHVPTQRVLASSELLKGMNANVIQKIYPGMGHTISMDEIDTVNNLIFKY